MPLDIKLLLEERTNMLITSSSEGRVLFCSRRAERNFGYIESKGVGSRIGEWINPIARMDVDKILHDVLFAEMTQCEVPRRTTQSLKKLQAKILAVDLWQRQPHHDRSDMENANDSGK